MLPTSLLFQRSSMLLRRSFSSFAMEAPSALSKPSLWESISRPTLALQLPFFKSFSIPSIDDLGIWMTSTLKRRRAKMNKHKLKKRRKKMRLKSH